MENRDYSVGSTERARELRKAATPWEKILWDRLKKCGVRWRRQHSYNGFFLDLYCEKALLAAEADGAMHDPDYDAWWDGKNAESGVLTLRFTNVEIGAETDRCVAEILAVMRDRISER